MFCSAVLDKVLPISYSSGAFCIRESLDSSIFKYYISMALSQ